MNPSVEPAWGPVSRALFEDVQREVNRHGIVVWLDDEAHHTNGKESHVLLSSAPPSANTWPSTLRRWARARIQAALARRR